MFQVETSHAVEAEDPEDAVLQFLHDCVSGGAVVEFMCREIGGMGGRVVRVVVGPGGEEPPEPRLSGVSETAELEWPDVHLTLYDMEDDL